MKYDIQLPTTVTVESGLSHLLPKFLEARRENIRDLRAGIDSKDWEKISGIGHIMAGICGSFGFDDMGHLGRSIETLAREQKAEEIAMLTAVIEKNLAEVQIVYEA